MKKILFIGILITMLFIPMNNVYAKEGPDGEYSYIDFEAGNGDDYFIYDEGVAHNDILNGVTYDKSTNTLTMNSIKGDYNLFIYAMEDLQIKVVGNNEISTIYADRFGTDTTLNFTGDGSITINKDTKELLPVALIGVKMSVDETVSFKAYAPEKNENDAEYVSTIIYANSMDTSVSREAINFKGSIKDIAVGEREWAHAGTKIMLGISYYDLETPVTYTLVEKNNKVYGMTYKNNKYVVTGEEIRHDEVNNIYFVDTSTSVNDNEYSTLEAVTNAGYTNTNQEVTIDKEANTYAKLIFADSDDNKYAVFIDHSGDEDIYYVYDITDKKMTLANEKEYILLKANNINVDNLEPEEEREYQDTYKFTILGTSLEVVPNTYEFIDGANQTYVIGKKGISFKIQADYDLFNEGGKVFIDGKEITDYTSSKGSTVISLSDAYLSTLSLGKHNIKVLFNNGESSETSFTIAGATEAETTETETTESESTEKGNNPKTSDSIINCAATLFISISGVVLVNKYKNKMCKN